MKKTLKILLWNKDLHLLFCLYNSKNWTQKICLFLWVFLHCACAESSPVIDLLQSRKLFRRQGFRIWTWKKYLNQILKKQMLHKELRWTLSRWLISLNVLYFAQVFTESLVEKSGYLYWSSFTSSSSAYPMSAAIFNVSTFWQMSTEKWLTMQAVNILQINWWMGINEKKVSNINKALCLFHFDCQWLQSKENR